MACSGDDAPVKPATQPPQVRKLLFYADTAEAIEQLRAPLSAALGGRAELVRARTPAGQPVVRPATGGFSPPTAPPCAPSACTPLSPPRQTAPVMLEVLPPGASKGSGLMHMLAALRVPLARVAAVGDGDNDVEMLRLARPLRPASPVVLLRCHTGVPPVRQPAAAPPPESCCLRALRVAAASVPAVPATGWCTLLCDGQLHALSAGRCRHGAVPQQQRGWRGGGDRRTEAASLEARQVCC